MHEHDRLALAFVEKGDFHLVVREARHAATITPAFVLCISRRPAAEGGNLRPFGNDSSPGMDC